MALGGRIELLTRLAVSVAAAGLAALPVQAGGSRNGHVFIPQKQMVVINTCRSVEIRTVFSVVATSALPVVARCRDGQTDAARLGMSFWECTALRISRGLLVKAEDYLSTKWGCFRG